MEKNCPPDQTRREFCTRAIPAATLTAALATLLEGCGKSSNSPTSPTNVNLLPTLSGSRTGSTVTVTVTGTALASVGGAALVNASGTQILVAQTSANSFSALTAICTHEACAVTGQGSGSTFVCPCHGSTYDFTGRVVTGPAPRALTSFATQFSNGVLTIAT